jgi:hypothetical protein
LTLLTYSSSFFRKFVSCTILFPGSAGTLVLIKNRIKVVCKPVLFKNRYWFLGHAQPSLLADGRNRMFVADGQYVQILLKIDRNQMLESSAAGQVCDR